MYAIHAQYDSACVPDKQTAYRFIDESRLLKALSSTAVDMYEQVMSGTGGFVEYPNDMRQRKLSCVSERFIDATLRFEYIREQLDTIEVIPERMVQKALHDAYRRRASIRDVFAEHPLDQLPVQLVEAAHTVRLLQVA